MGLDLNTNISPEEIDRLSRLLQGDRGRACYFCRYWREERDDPRQPRWGACIRMSVQPFPGMMVVAEDDSVGAMLMTSPKHYCSEFEE